MTSELIFSRKQRYLLSVLSGVLLVLSFPYTGSLFPLIFVALIPLLLIEHDLFLQKGRSGKLFLHSFIAFYIYILGTTYYLFHTESGTIPFIIAYAVYSVLFTLVFMLFHWTKKQLGFKWGSLLFIFLWLAYEYIHLHWELRFPWFHFGQVFATAPQVIQWYSYTGVLGGTLWVLVVNLLFFRVFHNVFFKKESFRQQRKLILLGIAAIAIPALLSWSTYVTYSETKSPKEVVVVQPNILPYTELDELDQRKKLDLFTLKAEGLITAHTSIIVAPETMVRLEYSIDEADYKNNRAYKYLQHYADRWGGPSIFLGAITHRVFDEKVRATQKPLPDTNQFYEIYNSAVLISTDKPPVFAHKSNLLVLGEKIPFAEQLPFLEDFVLELGGPRITYGRETVPRVMHSNGINIAPVICFESVFGEWIGAQCKKGADAIFIISNDSWWGDTPGYRQHAIFARLRAIENRRYIVRSAMTGTSSIINQRGEVVRATKYGVHDAFRRTIQLNDKVTFYAQYGDWVGRVSVYVAILLMSFGIYRFVRRKISKQKA